MIRNLTGGGAERVVATLIRWMAVDVVSEKLDDVKVKVYTRNIFKRD